MVAYCTKSRLRSNSRNRQSARPRDRCAFSLCAPPLRKRAIGMHASANARRQSDG